MWRAESREKYGFSVQYIISCESVNIYCNVWENILLCLTNVRHYINLCAKFHRGCLAFYKMSCQTLRDTSCALVLLKMSLDFLPEMLHVICKYAFMKPHKALDSSYIGDRHMTLTPLPMYKKAMSQTIFSYSYQWMKDFVFCLKCHWTLFLEVQLIINQL